MWWRKLHGSDRVKWQQKKEDYVMAGEHKQLLFTSPKGLKTSKWML